MKFFFKNKIKNLNILLTVTIGSCLIYAASLGYSGFTNYTGAATCGLPWKCG